MFMMENPYLEKQSLYWMFDDIDTAAPVYETPLLK